MAQAQPSVARCANAAGDGAIIQTAVATRKTVHIIGPCHLDSSVSFTTPGQLIYGDGRTVTVMNISTVVNARGYFVFNTGEPGPIIRDIGFSFSQPNVSVRSGLINYPPAIYAVATPRFRIEHVRISGAMGGVNMTGNSGGAVFDDFEESAFSYGVWADGSLDTVRFHNWHFWPFALTANQYTIWDAPNGGYPATSCTPQTTSGTAGPIGLYSGRLDGLQISDSLFLVGQSACFFQGSTGPTFGTITGTGFDTYSGVTAFAGEIQISASYFSLADNLHQAIYTNAPATVQCSNCKFSQGNGFKNMAVVDINGGNVILNNAFFNAGTSDAVLVRIENAGALTISGMQFVAAMPSPTNPKICLNCGGSGGQFVVNGVMPLSPITSGILFSVGADGYNRLIGNDLNAGWVNRCPRTAIHAVYANNGSSNPATCN
jgi:hypothetical protein